MDDIVRLIQNEEWEKALSAFLQYSEAECMDETSYIIGAHIMEHYRQWNTMFSLITEGLKLNPNNYELYLLLGNYYSVINNDQAYLSYENALFHCINSMGENSDDTNTIKQIIAEFKEHHTISVNNVSFVILSYDSLEYTQLCIDSIRSTCYDKCIELIVVDNASTDGSLEWLREQSDIKLVENKENKGFPKGCNQGIDIACKNNDIFLLNNDTIILPNSLYWLRIGLYNNQKTGAAGAVTNYAINEQIVGGQYDTVEEYIINGTKLNIPSLNPYELKAFLVMFAMLIKREAIRDVGVLDERFTPGNFEDNDYGIRLMKNGYDSVLCHNCYIYHFGSKSFKKDITGYKTIFWRNRDKFRDKWGFYDDYYTHARNDVIGMIDTPCDQKISVLEVGCGLGETLAKIKFQYPNAEVHGIEIVEQIAAFGKTRFDIVCGDIENMNLNEEKYDYIIFADVLEHLKYPERVLELIKKNLKYKGRIITSIPNLMNAGVIYDLLRGDFTYKDAGILDKTHLRFFTYNEIKKLFEKAGYRIDHMLTTVLPNESTNTYGDFFDKLLEIDGVAGREMFDVYQFIIRATPQV